MGPQNVWHETKPDANDFFPSEEEEKVLKITVVGSPAEIISSLRRSYSRIQNHIPSTTINKLSLE
jgi:hypothetical protein